MPDHNSNATSMIQMIQMQDNDSKARQWFKWFKCKTNLWKYFLLDFWFCCPSGSLCPSRVCYSPELMPFHQRWCNFTREEDISCWISLAGGVASFLHRFWCYLRQSLDFPPEPFPSFDALCRVDKLVIADYRENTCTMYKTTGSN